MYELQRFFVCFFLNKGCSARIIEAYIKSRAIVNKNLIQENTKAISLYFVIISCIKN